jgi:hypothetical protein
MHYSSDLNPISNHYLYTALNSMSTCSRCPSLGRFRGAFALLLMHLAFTVNIRGVFAEALSGLFTFGISTIALMRLAGRLFDGLHNRLEHYFLKEKK